jgi:alpha-L-rhamnosidase
MKQDIVDGDGKAVGQLNGPWWLNDSPVDAETEYPAQEAFFRIEFSGGAGAQFQLTAGDFYQVWLNGHWIGCGPARASHGRLTVDTWALPPAHLRDKNTLAVQIFWEGIFTYNNARGTPGLWYSLRGDKGDIATELWITDETGRLTTHRASHQRGWVEEIDGRQRAANWPTGPWTAAQWKKPVERKSNALIVLEARDIKPFSQRKSQAQSVTFVGACDPKSRTPHRVLGYEIRLAFSKPEEASSTLLQEEALQSSTAKDENLSALTASGSGVATLAPDSAGLDRTVQLDFGKLVVGMLELRLDVPAGTVVDFGWSEGHWEDERMGCWARSPHPDGAVTPREPNDSRQGMRYISAGNGVETFFSLFIASFRNLRIAFRVPGKAVPIRVHDLTLTAHAYPITEEGGFRCNDDSLNRIYRGAIETMACSIDDTYLDCPGRERGAWLNDSFWASCGFLDVTGDAAFDRRFLRQFIDSQDAIPAYEGSVAALYPGDPKRWRGMDNGQPQITGHAFFWLIQVERHLRLFGDAALKEKWRVGVERCVACFNRYINPEGLLENVPCDSFFDWSQMQGGPIFTPDNFLYSVTLAKIGEAYGRDDWKKLGLRMAEAADRLAWEPGRELYADAITRTDKGLVPNGKFSALTNNVALWARTGDAAKAERIWRQLKNFHPMTMDRQMIDYETNFVRGNLYSVMYRLTHEGRRGELDMLVRDLRETFLPMFERGQTTFSEHLGYHASLCHGYSVYVAHVMHRFLAGIYLPETPGGTIQIRPQPGTLGWCQSRVAWMGGHVQVWWSRNGKELEILVSVPEGQSGEVILGNAALVKFAGTLHTKLPI